MKNAFTKLWAMYHDSNNAILDEMIGHGKVVKEVAE
jgi:hypothetical protein